MSRQMIRVISSPSCSTTGFATLIFAINHCPMLRCGKGTRAYTKAMLGKQSQPMAFSEARHELSRLLFERFSHLGAALHITSMDVRIGFYIEPINLLRRHELL